MATRDDIYTALRNADAAGDTASAQKLAAYLKTMPAEAPAAAEPVPGADKGYFRNAVNAFGTGIVRSAAGLAGLPVDAASNVLDLGKSVLGSGYIAATGREPPEALQLVDRKKVPLSGDYIVNKLSQYTPGLVNAENPEFQGGYIQAAGGAPFAIVNPKSRAELAQQAVTGVVGTLGSKAGSEMAGPAGAVIGALLPHAAARATTAAVKTAVRGGEAGRQDMAQRVADLQAAGIENPTLGLASGRPLIGGVENLLANTPGAVGIMRKAREDAVNGMQAKTDAAAAASSQNRGTLESGKSIQRGVASTAEANKLVQADLYDKLNQYIPGTQAIPVGQTGKVLNQLTSTIPGAEETSQAFVNGKISKIKSGFDVDTNAVASGPTITAKQPVMGAPNLTPNAMGVPVASGPMRTNAMGVQVPAGNPLNPQQVVIPPRTGGWLGGLGVTQDAAPTLPFEAVKKLRTSVGSELTNNSLIQDVPNRQYKQLYAGLSGDIQDAATQAGPQAASAFNRANDYTRSSIDRLERVAPIVDKPAPEQTFGALQRALAENTSTFQAVKKTLPEGARGDFAGTVIERLGKATPGQQDSTGGAWSPETFLTNWNKMAPKAREELLSGFPNADQVRTDVQKVADAASVMRSNSKMWANPSGTAANVAARGTLGAIGVGGAGALAGLVNPLVPVTAAGGVGAANLLARGVTSKRVRDAILRKQSTSPQLQATDAILLNELTQR